MTRSSRSAARTDGEQWMTVFHATTHNFDKAAQKAIVKAFQNSPKGGYSKIVFDEDYKIWEVQCLAQLADVHLNVLESVVTRYISQQPLQLSEQPPAEADELRPEEGDELDIEEQLAALLLPDGDAVPIPQDERRPVAEWDPLPETDLAFATSELLEELKTVTGGNLRVDEVARRILIFDVEWEQSCDICDRLDILQSEITRRPQIHHTLRGKRGEGSRLKFRPLCEIEDDTLRRILLPPLPVLSRETAEDPSQEFTKTSILWHYKYDPATQGTIPHQRTFTKPANNDGQTEVYQNMWHEPKWLDVGAEPPNLVEPTTVPPLLKDVTKIDTVLPIGARALDVEHWRETVELPTTSTPIDPPPGITIPESPPKSVLSTTGSSITDMSLSPGKQNTATRPLNPKTWNGSTANATRSPIAPSDWPRRADSRNNEQSSVWGDAVEAPNRSVKQEWSVSQPDDTGSSSTWKEWANVAQHTMPPANISSASRSQRLNASKQHRRGDNGTQRGMYRGHINSPKGMDRRGKAATQRSAVSVPRHLSSQASLGNRHKGGLANNMFALIDLEETTSDFNPVVPPGYDAEFDLIDIGRSTRSISIDRPMGNAVDSVGRATTIADMLTNDLTPLTDFETEAPILAQDVRDRSISTTTNSGMYGTPTKSARPNENTRVIHSSHNYTDEIIERIAPDNDEADKKVFYRTMRQKKPSPGKASRSGKENKAQSALDFLKQDLQDENMKHSPPIMKTASAHAELKTTPVGATLRPKTGHIAAQVRSVLKDAHNFRGRINMELQIGQIMLPASVVSISKDFFPGDQLMAKLKSAENSFGTIFDAFTNVLTSSSADTHEVADILRWPLVSQKADWEISCQEPNGVQTKIYVNATQSQSEIPPYADCGEKQLLGALYHHFPHHVYDARLVFWGTRTKDPSSIDGAKELIDSLYVRTPEGSPYPELQARDGILHVVAIRLRTTASFTYPSGFSDTLELRITRVQDFVIERNPLPENRGVLWAHFDMSRAERKADVFWHEVSLRDANPPPELSANVKLGPGEEATWDVENAVRDDTFYRDLSNAAFKLVEQMDGIGRKNVGPGNDEWQRIVKRRVKQAQKEAEMQRRLASGEPTW